MTTLKWIVGLAAVLVCVALATMRAPQLWVEAMGVHVPTDDILLDYATGVVWSVLLGLSILVWPVPQQHKRWLIAGWILKSLIALVVMLPYEERYSGLDCWMYFRQAHIPLTEIPAVIQRGGADLIVSITALHLNLGLDSYHAVKISFAMIGFVAIYVLYRSTELLTGRSSPWAFAAITLYPTVLFWSSILGKDPVVLLGIALYVWGVIQLATQQSPRSIALVLAGIALASVVRVWMGPILLLPCLFVVIARIKSFVWRTMTICTLLAALTALGSATIDRLAIRDASDLVEATRAVTDTWENTNSALDREIELNSAWDLVAFAPQGLFDTFFRPLPGDVPNTFGWIAGFENVLLLTLALYAATRFRFAYLRNAVFFWSLSLLLTWGLAYSLITYRDLGTAVRFKLQILPVLLGVIGFLITRRRRFVAPAAARLPATVLTVERSA